MSSRYESDCRSCQSLQGLAKLTNAPRVYESERWVVEHVSPTNVLGWFVIVLNRHAEAIHELEAAELDELNRIWPTLCRILGEMEGVAKEYVAQFAEKENFHHVHFHVIAARADWPKDWKGPGVFRKCIGDDAPGQIGDEEARSFCLQVKAELEKRLQDSNNRSDQSAG